MREIRHADPTTGGILESRLADLDQRVAQLRSDIARAEQAAAGAPPAVVAAAAAAQAAAAAAAAAGARCQAAGRQHESGLPDLWPRPTGMVSSGPAPPRADADADAHADAHARRWALVLTMAAPCLATPTVRAAGSRRP